MRVRKRFPATLCPSLQPSEQRTLSKELRRVRSILKISVEPLKIAYYKDYNTNEVIRVAR